jgi:hypothetical protein
MDSCGRLPPVGYANDRDTRSQGLLLPPIPSRQDFATQTYPTLEDWLDLALPKLGERRLLLNLDEFEKIGSAILMTENYIKDRAGRGNRAKYEAILAKVLDVEPEEHDRIPTA